METIKYHPLITCDKSPFLTAKFSSTDPDTAKCSMLYLEEIIPYNFLFFGKAEAAHIIHCPYCGKDLILINSHSGKNNNPLFVCRDCVQKAKININYQEE